MKTKRFLAAMITFCIMIFAFCIFTASAAEQGYSVDIATGNITLTETDGVKYANGTAYEGELTVTDSDTTIANVLTIESGEHDVTISSVTANQIDVSAGAKLNLTLAGESTIKPDTTNLAAIHVPTGAELVITENSTGSVSATGGSNAAGIGGASSKNSGKITICGGTVNATGGTYGAGIGGGNSGDGTNITISGGTVTATGGSNAAGIGGGNRGNGTNITISGGTVTAKGSDTMLTGAAGIGGGDCGSGTDITISDGTVTAMGGTTAAAIGSGGGNIGNGKNITISGGTVTAIGGMEGVSIGAADKGPFDSSISENLFVSPKEFCVIIIKETEEATEIIGEYTQETDITSAVDGIKYLYIYTTTCGGIHIDGDGNYLDEDANHKCDICDEYIDELHTDEDNNHLCDVCNQVASECVDENPADHICDICKATVSVCVDEDGDFICDICESIIIDISVGDITLTETDGVKYANGTAYVDALKIIDSDTTIAKVLTIQSGEHNVTIDSITVKQIKVATGAKLNLTLAGESIIELYTRGLAAIHVPEGAELVITENSTGSVNAECGDYAASIGGGDGESNGKITICGGTVNASAGTSGAGIGGGREGYGTNITITGGIVTTEGGNYAAGIGGGSNANGTNITITGGIVTTEGGRYAAGIGGGSKSDGTNITITGGTVTATSSAMGAGIGGGELSNGTNITISGGTVTATGGSSGAGIGGGSEGDGSSITITGGTVNATSPFRGAGIGGGYIGFGSDITISGGVVTATGGDNSAGIGGGYIGTATDITISGGTVTAIAGEQASAIGGGAKLTSSNAGTAENVLISPDEYCAITLKPTEDATDIIGKYTVETDVAAELKDILTVYIYTTTCGGNHFDEDNDHKCDVCEAYIDELHTDEDNNHLCDVCSHVVSECDFDTNNGFCSICGEIEVPELVDGYYQIYNAGNMFWFAKQVNEVDRTVSAVLMDDIDLENRSWTPIGSTGEDSNNFRGHFDGKNHTITNFYLDMQRAGLGLFGEVRLGTVENFTIYGEVKLTSDCSYVGGVIGSAPGANGTDVPDHNGATIRNITSYVNVILEEGSHGSSYIGGFIGYANHETIIENCSWYGTLDLGANRADSGVGGLVGQVGS